MRKTSAYARKRARHGAFDKNRHEVINPVTEAIIRSKIEADIQRLRTDTGLQAYMGDDAARVANMAGRLVFIVCHAAGVHGQPAPRMDDIPQDVLEGLVADALLRQKMLVSFDYDTGSMQTKLVPSDSSVISLQKGDYTGLVHSMPMHRLPELAEALNKRVASHLGAFSQHLQGNRPALGAM